MLDNIDKATSDFFHQLDQKNALRRLLGCILSLKNFYYYVNVDATGATAILQYLYNYEFDPTLQPPYFQDITNMFGIKTGGLGTGLTSLLPYHVSAKFYHQILLGKTPIFNFSSIRNPYTRFYRLLRNAYKNNGLNDNGVKAVIEKFNHMIGEKDTHLQTITNLISYDTIHYDYLIRFENFEADMKTLFPNFDNKTVVMKTDFSLFDQFYSHQELVNIVKETYKDDFKNFGYSLDYRECDKYNNDVIPRNSEKYTDASKNMQYDLNMLFGPSIADIGYHHDYKFSGTTLNFFIGTKVPTYMLDKLVTSGYSMGSFVGLEKQIIDMANKLINNDPNYTVITQDDIDNSENYYKKVHVNSKQFTPKSE